MADGELDADCTGLDEFLYSGLSAKAKLFVLSHALLQAFGWWSLGGRVENCLGGLRSPVCVFCSPEARHCLLSPARDPGNRS